MNKYIWIPEIIEETSAGNKQVALQSKLLMNRNIFLNGDINNDSANFFIQQLMYLHISYFTSSIIFIYISPNITIVTHIVFFSFIVI